MSHDNHPASSSSNPAPDDADKSKYESIIQDLKHEINFYRTETKRLTWEKDILNQDIKRMSGLFKSWVGEHQSDHNSRNISEESAQFNAMVKYPCKSISDLLQLNSANLLVTSSQAPHYIEYVNKAWCEQCGYQSDEVLGYTCAFLQGPLTDNKAIEAFMKDVKEVGYARMHVVNYTKTGKPFEVTISVYPVFDSVASSGPDSEVAVLTHFATVQTDIKALPSSFRGTLANHNNLPSARSDTTSSLDELGSDSARGRSRTSMSSSGGEGGREGTGELSNGSDDRHHHHDHRSHSSPSNSNNSNSNSNSKSQGSGSDGGNQTNNSNSDSGKTSNSAGDSSEERRGEGGDSEGEKNRSSNCEEEEVRMITSAGPSENSEENDNLRTGRRGREEVETSSNQGSQSSGSQSGGSESSGGSQSGSQSSRPSNSTSSSSHSDNSMALEGNYDRRSQAQKFEPKCVISQESFLAFGRTLRLSNLLRLMLSCNNAMVLTNRWGQIVHVNTAWSKLFGYELGEVEGRTCKFLQGPETDQAKARQLMEEVTHQDRSSSVLLMNYKKNGEKFLNKLIVVPLRGDYLNDEVSHYAGLCIPQIIIDPQRNVAADTPIGGMEIVLSDASSNLSKDHSEVSSGSGSRTGGSQQSHHGHQDRHSRSTDQTASQGIRLPTQSFVDLKAGIINPLDLSQSNRRVVPYPVGALTSSLLRNRGSKHSREKVSSSSSPSSSSSEEGQMEGSEESISEENQPHENGDEQNDNEGEDSPSHKKMRKN